MSLDSKVSKGVMALEIKKMVAVIGSGDEKYSHLSTPLGRWLAENGFSLVNGGGAGVMVSTAKAFCSVQNRKGLVVGVIPSNSKCSSPAERGSYISPPTYPNPYTEIAIRTHLHLSGVLGKNMASRNHIIILSADSIIALPGGPGTQSEIELAIEYRKPLVLVNPNGEWDSFANRALTVKTVAEAVEKI